MTTRSFARRALSALLAVLLTLAVFTVGASAIDTKNAQTINPTLSAIPILNFFTTTWHKPGDNTLLKYTAPADGKYRIQSGGWELYQEWEVWYALFKDSTDPFFWQAMFFVLDLPNYLVNFLFFWVLDKGLPDTDAVVEIYDANGKLIKKYDNEGFPLLKSPNDYRVIMELKKGQTIYLKCSEKYTTWGLAYPVYVAPVLFGDITK
ncbi:MAG: hypothetical protein LBR73_04005 [Oscillospiraceae bacterium]|jgi:hypothetical protein|nr:hypothetical protein [Oscillospiraceae bacterium]